MNGWDQEVYCLLCGKPQSGLSDHLRTACMKENVDAQLIDQEVMRAIELQMKWSKEGRIINIAEVKKIVKRNASLCDLAEYFEKQGFFVTNQKSSTKKKVIVLAKVEMEDVYKRLVEKKSVPSKNQTTFRNYCVATLLYMHKQSPKSIVEFKVQDWNNRRQDGDNVLLQLAKEQTLKLSETEHMFLDCYFCNIRPGYLKNSYKKKHENFFLTSSGPLSNPIADVNNLLRKYESVAQRRGPPTYVAMPEEQQSAECISPLSSWFAFEDKFPVTLHGKAPSLKQATDAGRLMPGRLMPNPSHLKSSPSLIRPDGPLTFRPWVTFCWHGSSLHVCLLLRLKPMCPQEIQSPSSKGKSRLLKMRKVGKHILTTEAFEKETA
ncbi:uncharacterized protein LOC130424505 isoform X3 [Triplophysa dalaica]|uniref:uncharacterized protein LOC130424505 isoform X3 n=1 Tax=Triplophysa dalaica TaxID=1582913 RepID=UPI0024DFFD32|nr:uncharacterized protein LOC130424505 isoform X3 [Triplophysa dalaica]